MLREKSWINCSVMSDPGNEEKLCFLIDWFGFANVCVAYISDSIRWVYCLSLQVHLYGTSLGGFLAQMFAQHRPRRVKSLLLSNTYVDNHTFQASMSWSALWVLCPLPSLPLVNIQERLFNYSWHFFVSFKPELNSYCYGIGQCTFFGGLIPESYSSLFPAV